MWMGARSGLAISCGTAASAVMDTLKDLNRDGLTIILVTHNEALLSYCSRHVVCRDGRLIAATA